MLALYVLSSCVHLPVNLSVCHTVLYAVFAVLSWESRIPSLRRQLVD